MTAKILLDTDIGSDLDDSVCLAYLLSQPKCELLGITTVSGDVNKRAMLASAMCKAAGKEIPIYPGASDPLLVPHKETPVSQQTALANWEHESSFPQGEAIEFLRKTIRENPGEVTLVAIGPMTNIALLFSVDPEIPSLLKELVLMCGLFTNRIAGVGPLEWNALWDPHATAIVYHAPVKTHRSIGLDVTCQVTMNKKEVVEHFKADNSKILKLVMDFSSVWFSYSTTAFYGDDKLTFHDPLAIVSIFDDEVCTFERGKVDIELASPKMLGAPYWEKDSSGHHEVALEVNRDKFFEHYFSVVNK